MTAQRATTGSGDPAAVPGESRFRRPVSPTEWSYLAAARLGQLLVLQLAAEGEGTIDPLALSRAVARASASCPGSRLVRRGRTWVDSGRPARVSVADAGTFDGNPTGPAELAGRLADAENSPSCEVLLFAGEPSTVVFRASHAVMDLKGLSVWAADVFRALRGEPLHGAADPMSDYTLLDTAGRTGPRPRLGLDQRSPLAGRPGNTSVWRRRTIAGRHAALAAKTAAAIAEYAPGPTSRIMFPVDLRRHAPGMSSTANLALPVFLEVPTGQCPDTLHRRLLDALASRRELAAGAESALARLPLPVAAALVGASRAATSASHRYPVSAIVSNAGRLAPADLSAGDFTAKSIYALPVHAPLVPLSIALTELPGHIEVVASARGAADVGERCEALLDRVESALGAAAPAAGTRSTPQISSAQSALSGAAAAPVPRSAGAAHTPPAAPLREPGAAERLLAPGPGGLPSLDTTVVQSFRSRAARHPDVPAVLGDDLVWSYADLDRRSDAVAAELLARGSRRGEVVGILADRSPAGLAGVWGILKAGAAFLPVDVGNPAQRVGELLHDAQARFCLAEGASYATAAHCGGGVTTILLDDIADPADPADAAGDGADVDARRREEALMAAAPRPDDLAYVIYTSGSTGRPKGVQIEHRSLVNLIGWISPFMRCDEETRAAYSFSPGFDLSVMQIFPPLLHGGAVVPVPGELDHVKLREMFSGRRANTLGLTPTHLALAERLGLRPTGIRALQLGGENLTAASGRRARASLGSGCLVVNVYGPTEATVACTVAVVDGDVRRASTPIGVPVHRMSAVVLDEQGREVEDGELGELVVSGVQLARGYLGRPELTAERFVYLPDGRRAYRTGDLALRLPDGQLEYAGRIDSQVKIRGHRVEPGEVEAALTALPGVAGAAVVARPRRDTGGQALCAFVVPDGEGVAAFDESAARAELSRTLPPHLLPAIVRAVAAFPETASGKTDRNALPNPFDSPLGDPFGESRRPRHADAPRPAAGAEWAALPEAEPAPGTRTAVSGTPVPGGVSDPGVDVAGTAAGIWARVLRCDAAHLGPSSDFHELGGDSLAVLEMLSALGEELLERGSERDFLSGLGPLSENLTLGRVVEAVEARRSVS
ncbi:non-ribosomal peptide synthetase [Streptomyces pacificus]|uniref:Non-ribosomal peptide synthetase n=1 Tax=Streptomyces pacificus TaxID=2705029 RepID=A0A6A0B4K4_9ACTN|nr:non-ribosomal peptide synthetase [Streptomyces pacificus]GFH39438.1 non-ribosomal peptide synthetase [Streptomyces pacificus]